MYKKLLEIQRESETFQRRSEKEIIKLELIIFLFEQVLSIFAEILERRTKKIKVFILKIK